MAYSEIEIELQSFRDFIDGLHYSETFVDFGNNLGDLIRCEVYVTFLSSLWRPFWLLEQVFKHEKGQEFELIPLVE